MNYGIIAKKPGILFSHLCKMLPKQAKKSLTFHIVTHTIQSSHNVNVAEKCYFLITAVNPKSCAQGKTAFSLR
jgi:hypothetical protein